MLAAMTAAARGVSASLAEGVVYPIDGEGLRLRMSDRFVARLPGLFQRLSNRLMEEPPGSPRRRWMISRALSVGFAALDKRDWDYLQRLYSPDIVLMFGEGIPLDVAPHIEGWPRMRAELADVFEFMISNYIPSELIDLGGPFCAARVAMTMKSPSSGAEAGADNWNLYEFRAGVVVRQWSSGSTDQIDGWLAERLAA